MCSICSDIFRQQTTDVITAAILRKWHTDAVQNASWVSVMRFIDWYNKMGNTCFSGRGWRAQKFPFLFQYFTMYVYWTFIHRHVQILFLDQIWTLDLSYRSDISVTVHVSSFLSLNITYKVHLRTIMYMSPPIPHLRYSQCSPE
jgi:hypothetical protein